MSQFWDQSWDTVDPGRVARYVQDTELDADSLIAFWKKHHVQSVCDAGCGCGVYSLKLAANGFRVSGFDVSAKAVEMTKKLLSSRNFDGGDFEAADILSTPYPDHHFDAVISRDVVDHMPLAGAIQAVKELYRITKPGGFLVLTLDSLDSEYETQKHTVNADGDYLFTEGKWKGMVFHPYSESQIAKLTPFGKRIALKTGLEGFQIILEKS